MNARWKTLITYGQVCRLLAFPASPLSGGLAFILNAMKEITEKEAREILYREAPDYVPASEQVESLVLIAIVLGYNAAVKDFRKLMSDVL